MSFHFKDNKTATDIIIVQDQTTKEVLVNMYSNNTHLVYEYIGYKIKKSDDLDYIKARQIADEFFAGRPYFRSLNSKPKELDISLIINYNL